MRRSIISWSHVQKQFHITWTRQTARITNISFAIVKLSSVRGKNRKSHRVSNRPKSEPWLIRSNNVLWILYTAHQHKTAPTRLTLEPLISSELCCCLLCRSDNTSTRARSNARCALTGKGCCDSIYPPTQRARAKSNISNDRKKRIQPAEQSLIWNRSFESIHTRRLWW